MSAADCRLARGRRPHQRRADADPVTTEIVRQGLNAAADQMKRALVRTAFSPVIYEVLDFAAALYDRDVCHARPGADAADVHGHDELLRRGAVEAVGGEEALEPGDIILYNVPYGTGSHPQDAAMVMPVFLRRRRAGRLRGDQGALARHRRQGAVLHRHRRRLPGGHDLPGRQAVLARPPGRRTSTASPSPTRACRRWWRATSTRTVVGVRTGAAGARRAWSSATASSASASASSACTTTARRVVREWFERDPRRPLRRPRRDGRQRRRRRAGAVRGRGRDRRLDACASTTRTRPPQQARADQLPAAVDRLGQPHRDLDARRRRRGAQRGPLPADRGRRPGPARCSIPLPPAPCFLYGWAGDQAIEVIYQARRPGAARGGAGLQRRRHLRARLVGRPRGAPASRGRTARPHPIGQGASRARRRRQRA